MPSPEPPFGHRVFESYREPGVTIEPVADGTFRISLWGELPVGWSGRLAAGLAARGCDIRSGRAALGSKKEWLAEFIVVSHGERDPASIDYLAICREAPPLARDELRLASYVLRRPGDGSLELSVTAPDRMGFLANLLGRLGFFALFPQRMRIDSDSGLALDVLSLYGVFGVGASSEIEGALRAFLEQSLERPAGRARRSLPPGAG